MSSGSTSPGCRLSTVFLAKRGAAAPVASPDALEDALLDAHARGRAAWPDVPLSDEAFVAHLADVVPAAEDPVEALATLETGDLYLACRSALGVWVRVVALRTALNLQRGELRRDDAGSLGAIAAGGDVEIDYIRARYQEEFTRALREAFAALSSKQRNVLRLRFLEGLTDEKIGRLFGVHQTTATRWVAAAREAVFHGTRRRLRERLQLGTGEFDSLLVALRSQLELSITGLLQNVERC